jgi:hypothetical protein
MDTTDATVTQVANGWHCGSRSLNLTVLGSTPEEARRLFAAAAAKAAEIRARPAPPADPDRFANPS